MSVCVCVCVCVHLRGVVLACLLPRYPPTLSIYSSYCINPESLVQDRSLLVKAVPKERALLLFLSCPPLLSLQVAAATVSAHDTIASSAVAEQIFPLRAEPCRQRIGPLLRRLAAIMSHPSQKGEARKLYNSTNVQGEIQLTRKTS